MSIRLDGILTDNAVLQRGKPIVVCGSCNCGDEVTVSLYRAENGFCEEGEPVRESAAAVENRRFRVELAPIDEAGGEYYLIASAGEGAENKRTAKWLTVGDVYFLAGQSNMERMVELQGDISPYNGNPQKTGKHIRGFNYYKTFAGTDRGRGAETPQNELKNVAGIHWELFDTQDKIAPFSAIGFFFASELNEKTGVPIGLISVAVGGTGIDSWLPGGVYYNSRVYPFRDTAIAGVLWYQGENDGTSGMPGPVYAEKQAGLIDEYRRLWKDEELPFYFAELSRVDVWIREEGNDGRSFDHSGVRRYQYAVPEMVKKKKKVALIPTVDLFGTFEDNKTFRDTEKYVWAGNARHDVHPWFARPLAHRFASVALKEIYDLDLVCYGPRVREAKKTGSGIEVRFDVTGSLALLPKESYCDSVGAALLADDPADQPGEFELSADGEHWTGAEAEIAAPDRITVKDAGVPGAKFVRYCGRSYPEKTNVTDQSGIAAYSFEIEIR